MSIIYDALKKVESTPRPKIEKVTYQPRLILRPFFLYLLIICVGLFLANTFFAFLSSPKKPVQSVNSQKVPAVASVNNFVSPTAVLELKKGSQAPFILSGVFFSEDEGYAIVNDQIVRTGDVIGGATVKQITLSEVVLENWDSSVIKLSNKK